MIVRKSSNDICATRYKYHMWQKGGGMFCHGVEVEEKEEKADDDSDLDLDYKGDYNHSGNWDPEELLVKVEEEEEEEINDNNNGNKEEDEDGYTSSECAYMNVTLEDNKSVESVEEEEEEEEEEKDERYYLREKKAVEKVAVINNLRLHINEARSLRHEARNAVGQ